jgi:hypothetical protein
MKIETTISRRELLASAPAVAVAGAPSVATALGAFVTGDDTELLELGRKLAPVVAELNAARAVDRDRLRYFEAKLIAFGLKEEAAYPNVNAYMDERHRLGELVLKEEADEPDLDFDRMHTELFALLDEILAVQPTTLKGFAVQVLAIVTAHDELLDDPEEVQPYGLVTFLQNTCRFAGVPLPETAA